MCRYEYYQLEKNTLCFCLAYFAVPIIGVGHSYFNWLVLGKENDPKIPVKTAVYAETSSRITLSISIII